MFVPNYSDGEYLSANALTQAATDTQNSIAQIPEFLHTPGVVNPVLLSISTSGMNATAVLPTGLAVVFSYGTIAEGLGITDGTTSDSYTVSFSSLVPGSGSVTAYLVAILWMIHQGPYMVEGPPPGHPDYDPTFQAFLAYTTTRMSLKLLATTTPPDGFAFIELGRVTLAAGQVSIPAIDVSHVVRAGAVLSQNGEVTAADLAAGAAAANVGALGGALTGFLPNPELSGSMISGGVGALGGVLTGTLPDPGMAPTGVLMSPAIMRRPYLTIGVDGRIYPNSFERTPWIYASATPGFNTFTVPVDVDMILVYLTGGGGGGAACDGTHAGGGGGAGMTAVFFFPVTGGTTYTNGIFLGSGGLGEVVSNVGALISAPTAGGVSQIVDVYAAGGGVGGGYTSGSDISASGGAPGLLSSSTLGSRYGSLLYAGYGDNGSYDSPLVGGSGGDSFWGGGSPANCGSSFAVPGANAPGSGGGGGYGIPASGRNGAPGYVLIFGL